MTNSKIAEHIEALKKDRDAIILLSMKMAKAGGGAIFPLDIFTFGAVKRNLSTGAALIALAEASNMLAARAMLRVHIDTALRFASAWFVDKPHDFATKVLAGEHIRKMKDRDGKLLQDARLVELLAPNHPWLKIVYENLSSYVHFSGSHIMGAVEEVGDGGTITFSLTELDEHYPEQSWIEVLDCAHEATRILAYYLGGWIRTKNLPREQFEAMKAARQEGD